MNPERYQRLQELFQHARELDSGERGSFLSEACAEDSALLDEVNSLLKSDAHPRHDFEPFEPRKLKDASQRSGTWVRDMARIAVAEMEAGGERPAWIPETIGAYRILRQIGAGGMGIVFEAEQERTERRVAIKVLRPGRGSRAHMRRFKIEAQALGRLTHPGIARIFDSGSVDSPLGALHYFVLELVDGSPIVRWARENKLDLRERCKLMAEVTDAVQEAHLRSVVHRDLKPANVLVDRSGNPRVLDFGVALLTDRDVHETSRTLEGQVIGTLPYMSPEQASGDVDAIDLRTDIYALGCVFYELLSGQPPFDPKSPTTKLLQAIRNENPAPLRAHDARLAGDLETITCKAMAKDKEERYASAASLAGDIRRYLAHEPIQARQHSALYHLRRYVRRNRTLVASAAIALLAVLIGSVASLLFALGERDANRIADTRAEDLQRRREVQAVLRAGEFVRAGVPQRAMEFLSEVRPASRGWEWSLLDALCAPPTRTIAETTGTIFIQSTSSDGTRLVCGGISGIVFLVDTESAEVLERIEIGGQVRGLHMSHDGMSFAGSSFHAEPERGRLFLWENGQLRFVEKRAAPSAWNAVRFAPDDSSLLWGWNDGTLAIYDLPGAKQRFRIQADSRPISDAVYSADGSQFATRSHRAEQIRLWDAQTGELLREFPSGLSWPADVAIDPSGELLFDLALGERLRVWDIQSGQAWPLGESVSSDALLCESIAFAPDASLFYVAVKGEIQVYDRLKKKLVKRIPTGAFHLREFVLSSDGVLLAGRSRWSSVLVLNTRTGRSAPIPTGLDGIWDLHFGAGNRALWLVDQGGKLTELQLGGGLSSFPGHGAAVSAVDYAWDGDLLVSAAQDGTLATWDPDTAQPVAVLASELPALSDIEVFPGGERVLAVGDGLAAIWNLNDGELTRRFEQAAGEAWITAGVLPSGEVALSASRGSLASWDTTTGELLKRVPLAGNGSLAISPGGLQVALGADDGLVYLYATDSLAPQAELAGHDAEVLSLLYSADGKHLVSAGADSAVIVWDIESRSLSVRLHAGLRPEGPMEVSALAFSPDGLRLAAGTEDGSIFLWESEQWELVLELDGHPAEINDLVFRPNGMQLVSASADTRIGLLDLRHPRERLALLADRERLMGEAAGPSGQILSAQDNDARARIARQMLLAQGVARRSGKEARQE